MVIPKPKKPVEDPKCYRPISSLCDPYKTLGRLIHACVKPIVDPLLPMEQAGFRRGRSIVDLTVLLSQNTEDSLEAKKKAGTVFVNLTAAYDAVWHRGLTCKLLRFLPDEHMIQIIMELAGIEASRSLLVTASKVGENVCKTASHRNESSPPSFHHPHIRSAFHDFSEVCIC